MAKLIFGCGYLGGRVADRWRAAGEQVFVVTRSTERAREFEVRGLLPIVADVTQAMALEKLPVVDTMLFAVGFDRMAGKSIHEVYVGGLQAALDALPDRTPRVIYISSTGVYGQAGGELVDEESHCQPEREGGRACLAAEQLLAHHPLGQRAVVLRMAGIYGPGRVPNREDLVAGRPLASPEHGFLNLIHVEDAASVVVAAATFPALPRTFVVSDGHPVERREYYEELARLWRAPPPQFVPTERDSPARARAAGDKRVNNARMLAELGVELAYPSYREGLAAIAAAC